MWTNSADGGDSDNNDGGDDEDDDGGNTDRGGELAQHLGPSARIRITEGGRIHDDTRSSTDSDSGAAEVEEEQQRDQRETDPSGRRVRRMRRAQIADTPSARMYDLLATDLRAAIARFAFLLDHEDLPPEHLEQLNSCREKINAEISAVVRSTRPVSPTTGLPVMGRSTGKRMRNGGSQTFSGRAAEVSVVPCCVGAGVDGWDNA